MKLNEISECIDRYTRAHDRSCVSVDMESRARVMCPPRLYQYNPAIKKKKKTNETQYTKIVDVALFRTTYEHFWTLFIFSEPTQTQSAQVACMQSIWMHTPDVLGRWTSPMVTDEENLNPFSPFHRDRVAVRVQQMRCFWSTKRHAETLECDPFALPAALIISCSAHMHKSRIQRTF